MKFGSLFSGVGGFDLGMERAGMTCVWQCEIDKYCNQVLNEHWKGAKRYNDVREITKGNTEVPDLICGGFPCQDLSVAGKRAGLSGERSGLWFEFERIIGELRPKWVVIENVPGLLSSNKGADFAVILKALDDFGYGVAWRILDSQYFGVAQRRRRVFIVASFGNGSCTEVLFESEGVSGNTQQGAAQGETITSQSSGSVGTYWDGGQRSDTLDSSSLVKGQMMPEKRRFPVVFDEMQITSKANHSKGSVDKSYTLNKNHLMSVANVWQMNHASEVYRESGSMSPTLQERMGTGGNNVPLIGVRRLTPTECCRLQGFPDDWNISQSDTQRYKQMGNAVTVNVIEWIGKRILNISCNSN